MKDLLGASVIACLLAALALAYFDVLTESIEHVNSGTVARASTHRSRG